MPGEVGAYARADAYETPAAGQERAVPLQFSRVVQQSETMRKLLEELQMRLAPLMGPDLPMNMVGDNNKRTPGCDMAEKLDHAVNMIAGGNAILANILKRLEI